MKNVIKITQRGVFAKNGEQALFLQYFQNRKRALIATGIKVLPLHWNMQSMHFVNSAKGNLSAQQVYDLNIELNKLRTRANTIMMDFRLMDRELTSEIFKKEFVVDRSRNDIIGFIEDHIKDNTGIKTKSTLSTYRQLIVKLKAYKKDVLFSDIDIYFAEGFKHMLTTKNKLKVNSAWKHQKNLRFFIREAIKKGYRLSNPYDSMKIEMVKTFRHFLEHSEITKLQNLYDNPKLPKELKNVLSRFLFSCYTGLRISDVSMITAEMIINDVLVFVPEKTRNKLKTVSIPLSDLAKKHINVSRGNLFTQISDQQCNRSLKEIAKLVGIQKKLTYHVSRHTFGTLFLESGGSVEVLKDLMGHSKIDTTMIYVHITHTRKRDQVKLMDVKLKVA